MILKLRGYQEKSINDTLFYVRDNPEKAGLVVIPPGGGKSLVIAEIVRKVVVAKPDRRFLILTHIKELVEQNYLEFINLCPGIEAGIYSAGLKKKESWQSVVFGTVQSFVNNEDHLFFHGLIIDEAHSVPPKGEGQYIQVFSKLKKENPNIKIIGFTATPYRMGSGLLTDDQGPFSDICHETKIRDLFDQGFLSPLISKKGKCSPDNPDKMSVEKRKNGDFETSAQNEFFAGSLDACKEMVREGEGRKKWIVFCPSIKIAKEVTANLIHLNVNAACLHNDINAKERKIIIEQFREAEEQVALVNVRILKEGFNVKAIDLGVLYFATKSIGLYYQVAGRCTRLAEKKEDAKILDFGGNIERHGPIDNLGVKRLVCPKCGTYQALDNKNCIECDYEFPKICFQCKTENKQEAIRCSSCNKPFGKKECLNEKCKHLNPLKATNCVRCGSEFKIIKKENLDVTANELPILSSEPIEITVRYELYAPEGKPPMVRVNYYTLNNSFVASEYLCFSHQSKAANIAKWWVKKLISDNEIYYRVKGNKLSNSWTAIEFLRNCKRKPLKIKLTKQKESRYKKVTIMEFTKESLNKEFRDNGNTVISKNEVMVEGEGKVLSIQPNHIVVDFGGRIERHPYRNGFIPGQNVTWHNGALLPCR